MPSPVYFVQIYPNAVCSDFISPTTSVRVDLQTVRIYTSLITHKNWLHCVREGVAKPEVIPLIGRAEF